MKVTERPRLDRLNSFGVPAGAGLLITIETEEDLLNSPVFDPRRDFILGGGSNVLFLRDVPGTVFLNRMAGMDVVEEHDGELLVDVGAGETWHDVVEWSLRQRWSGIENLALIPGLAGAGPIQNIGAYGVELASVLDSVTAWDWTALTWVVLPADACEFSYRDSRFKSREPDRYFITSIRLRLSRRFVPQLEYAGLRAALEDAGIADPTPTDVCRMVMNLRRQKLPDPETRGNAGSFFKNPIVSRSVAVNLRSRFPGLPVWPMEGAGEKAADVAGDRAKISAAWMIDSCGLKGRRIGQAEVSRKHALVLENLGGATGENVWLLAREVRRVVQEKFGVNLEPEPKIYGEVGQA